MSDTQFATAVEDLAATAFVEDHDELAAQLEPFDEDDLRKIVAVLLEDIVQLSGVTNAKDLVELLANLHAALALVTHFEAGPS